MELVFGQPARRKPRALPLGSKRENLTASNCERKRKRKRKRQRARDTGRHFSQLPDISEGDDNDYDERDDEDADGPAANGERPGAALRVLARDICLRGWCGFVALVAVVVVVERFG